MELLEELGVVFEECGDDPLERLVMLDLGVLTIRVLLRILYISSAAIFFVTSPVMHYYIRS